MALARVHHTRRRGGLHVVAVHDGAEYLRASAHALGNAGRPWPSTSRWLVPHLSVRHHELRAGVVTVDSGHARVGVGNDTASRGEDAGEEITEVDVEGEGWSIVGKPHGEADARTRP